MSIQNRLTKIVGRRSFWIVILTLVGSTLFHYCWSRLGLLGSTPLTRQAVGRILFIFPVASATIAYGYVWGLAMLILVVLVMLPRVFLHSSHPFDAFVEVMATGLVSLLVVWMHERHQKTVSRLKTISSVATVLTQSLELERILDKVLYRLLRVMNVEAGAVYLIGEDEQGLTLVAHQNLPSEITDEVDGLRSARMVARYEGLKCQLAVPLRSKGKLNGLLIIGNSKPCPALRREGELVGTVCRAISVVIENARLYESIARQLEVERCLCQVAEEITSELELDKVLPKMIQVAEGLAGADGGLVALWEEEGKLVTYPYLHNLPQALSRVSVPEGQGLSSEVITTGQPMVIDDYPNYPRALPPFVKAGVKSVAAVPIVNLDRVFGALAVVSLEKGKRFQDHDVIVLSGIGRQAGIAVENAYLYENLRFYARRIMQAQENERKRIARELHDDTIQSLIVLSRRLEALLTSDQPLPEAATRRVQELWEHTDNMIHRVRRFSQNLRPSILDDLGLLPTLEELMTHLERQDGLQAEFRVLGRKRRLSSEVELTLFRIAQEALSNVEKHAGASKVATTIELTDHVVRLTVEDNGKGFVPPTFTDDLTGEDRLGLIGMHERARLLGGKLMIISRPGQGTKVIVDAPS